MIIYTRTGRYFNSNRAQIIIDRKKQAAKILLTNGIITSGAYDAKNCFTDPGLTKPLTAIDIKSATWIKTLETTGDMSEFHEHQRRIAQEEERQRQEEQERRYRRGIEPRPRPDRQRQEAFEREAHHIVLVRTIDAMKSSPYYLEQYSGDLNAPGAVYVLKYRGTCECVYDENDRKITKTLPDFAREYLSEEVQRKYPTVFGGKITARVGDNGEFLPV